MVRAFHANLVRNGCAPGVRYPDGIDSAVARPQDTSRYVPDSSIGLLAAVLAYSLCKNHPFTDGNKRVAYLAGAAFLRLNGYKVECAKDEKYRVFTQIAAGELNELEIAGWYDSRMKRLL